MVVGDLPQVRRIQHGVVHRARAGAGEPAEELRIPFRLEGRIRRLGPADQGPVAARLEPAGDLGREPRIPTKPVTKCVQMQSNCLAWEVGVEVGGVARPPRPGRGSARRATSSMFSARSIPNGTIRSPAIASSFPRKSPVPMPTSRT